MIRVDVKPYCDVCPDFTPDVEYPVTYYAGFEAYSSEDTVIRCKYQKRCEAMVRYLEKHMAKEKDQG